MNNSITLWQLWSAIAVPAVLSLVSVIIALVGILVSNGRFTDLSKRMDDIKSDMLQLRTQTHTDIQLLLGWERERDKR